MPDSNGKPYLRDFPPATTLEEAVDIAFKCDRSRVVEGIQNGLYEPNYGLGLLGGRVATLYEIGTGTTIGIKECLEAVRRKLDTILRSQLV